VTVEYQNVLVTGAAGFIGFHLSKRLLENGISVVGLDNLSPYYSIKLKEDRLAQLEGHSHFAFVRLDLADREGMRRLFSENRFDVVVHLAAQAGVRYSLRDPHAYIDANIVGFMNILEGCRHQRVKHLVFASSSSVYGANTKMPFSVHQNVDHPVSLYAATKKANELMAHTYSHLYGLACTGLRFFTVYGPWGRPDMALFLFTDAILNGRPIQVFNHGRMQRDFTYIDDIIEGVVRVMGRLPEPDRAWRGDKIYNIGNNQPVELDDFIKTLEGVLGLRARKEYLDMQPGDVPATYADVDDLMTAVGFRPATPVRTGIERFVAWYQKYYAIL